MENNENKTNENVGGGNPAPSCGNFFRTLKHTTICALVTAVVVCGLLAVGRIAYLEASLRDALADRDAVKITSIRIKDRLLEIGELSTASYEYENTRTITDTRNLMGWDIPGTSSTINLSYCGVVKVGYDVTQIEAELDPDKLIILISLPQPEVKDNYIKLDGLICSGSNNLLNPISVADLPLFFEDVTVEALEGAKNHGIFEAAEERMEGLVTEFLAVFPGCTIIFR